MKDKVFVDTNILIYAHDLDSGEKHHKSSQAIRYLWETGVGVLSTQVLQEFYVNVTKKISKPIDRKEARKIIGNYKIWTIQQADLACILNASRIEEESRISFWDALIVAAAKASHATKIWSEDFSHGHRIDDVLIENPMLL